MLGKKTLKDYQEALGLSNKEMAELLGISARSLLYKRASPDALRVVERRYLDLLGANIMPIQNEVGKQVAYTQDFASMVDMSITYMHRMIGVKEIPELRKIIHDHIKRRATEENPVSGKSTEIGGIPADRDAEALRGDRPDRGTKADSRRSR